MRLCCLGNGNGNIEDGSKQPRDPSRPPNGGYGWVITFVGFLLMTHVALVVSTCGIFLVEFTEAFDISNTALSIIGAFQLSSGFLLGGFIGSLVRRFGCRVVTMVASVIMASGYALSSLAQSAFYLYFTFGLMASIGMSTYMTTGIIPIQRYFDTRLALAAGLAWVGISAGVFIGPPLVRYLISVYSWRGALIMMGGIHLHGALYGALLIPLPKPPTPLTTVCSKEKEALKNGDIQKETHRVPFSRRVGLACKSVMDLSPLGNLAFSFYIIAVILIMSGHILPLAYIPLRCFDLGISKNKAALMVSVSGILGMTGRFIAGWVVTKSGASRPICYGVCGIITGVLTAISASLTHFPLLITYAALYGFMSGTYVSIGSTVIIDILGVNKCVSGSAIFVMAFGVAYASTPATAGVLLDLAGSAVPFLTFGITQIVGGLFSISAHFLHQHKLKTKRKRRFEDQFYSQVEIVNGSSFTRTNSKGKRRWSIFK